MRNILPTLIVTLLALTPGLAQQVRIARIGQEQNPQGQVYGGILRTLTDTERDYRNTTAPPQRTDATQQTQQLQQAQRIIQLFANEAGQLIPALRYEEQYSPAIGRLLGDALRVKASADVLAQRSQTISELSFLAHEYEGLDQQWRLLSYQLTQTMNLNAVARQRVDRLNAINEDLSKRLKVTPQFNRTELIYYFSVLGEELDSLSDEIQIDLHAHPQRDQYLQKVRNLRNSSQQLRLANEYQYPYEAVKSYYEEFHSDWLNTKGEMRGIQNHHVQRCISRVTRFNDRIHELLFLPPMIDGNDILYQAETLERQIDSIGAGIPLVTILELPNADDVFSKVKEFHELSHEFRNTVGSSPTLDPVRWDFRVLEVAWTDLKRVIAPAASTETVQNVAVLDSAISELRSALALGNSHDSQQAYEMVGKLSNLTDLLNYDIRRYVSQSGQFPTPAQNQLVTTAQQFHNATLVFQKNVQLDGSAPQLRAQAMQLGQKWGELQKQAAMIPRPQRDEMVRTTQSISTIMARLQLSFGF